MDLLKLAKDLADRVKAEATKAKVPVSVIDVVFLLGSEPAASALNATAESWK
jgi:hypothetical protein